jgi:hypothetical protein
MALQGKYDFKGIEIPEAYIKVDNISYNGHHMIETVEKSAAVYNSDGSLKTAAVMEDKWVEKNPTRYTAKVYKDKAARDSNPDILITEIYGGYEMSKTSSAKNAVIQAYNNLKAKDDYKDYTDV